MSNDNYLKLIVDSILNVDLVQTEVNGWSNYYCVFCKGTPVENKGQFKHHKKCILWLVGGLRNPNYINDNNSKVEDCNCPEKVYVDNKAIYDLMGTIDSGIWLRNDDFIWCLYCREMTKEEDINYTEQPNIKHKEDCIILKVLKVRNSIKELN